METFLAHLFLAPLTAVFFGFLIWLFPAVLLRNRISQFQIRPFVFFVTGYVFTFVQAIYLLASQLWVAPLAGTLTSLGLVWVVRDRWRRRRPAWAEKVFGFARRGQGKQAQAGPHPAPGQHFPGGYPGQQPAPGQPYYGPPVPPGTPPPPGSPPWPGSQPQPGQPQPGQPWPGQPWPGQPPQGPQPGQRGPQGPPPSPEWAGGQPWMYPRPGLGGADAGQPPTTPPRPGPAGPPAFDRPGPAPTGRPDESWPASPPGPPSRLPADDAHPDLPQLDEPLLIPDYPPNFDELPAPPTPRRTPGPAGSPDRDGRDAGADTEPGPGAPTPAADDPRGASSSPGAGPDAPPPSGRGPGRRAAGYPWAAPPPGEAPNPGPEPPDPDD